jgi:Kef-type K+ transport system membrane component KefB
MSIISLTIAPLIAGNGDWPSDWWKGLIPIFLMIIGTYLVYVFFWKNAESITPINTSSEKVLISMQRKAVTELM